MFQLPDQFGHVEENLWYKTWEFNWYPGAMLKKIYDKYYALIVLRKSIVKEENIFYSEVC